MNEKQAADGHFAAEQLTQLVEALPVGVFILRADGSAVYANRAAEALLGRGIMAGDEASNLGERFAAYRAGTNDTYPPEEMPIVRALSGERSVVEDMEIHRHGERLALEVTATPILDAGSHIIFAVAVFQDITLRKKAQAALATLNVELEQEVVRRTADLALTIASLEQEIAARRVYETELENAKRDAERANRAKGVFLLNVSHELRTPLHQIIGFSDLLNDRLTEERTKRLAESALASGKALLEKVDALIELARADAPRSTDAAEFDLHASVVDLASRMGMSCEFSAPLGRARGLEETVRQIIADLCGTAATAGDTEKAIMSVRVDRQTGSAHLHLRVQNASLSRRVRALDVMFGDVPTDDGAKYHQEPVDLRLAVTRANIRSLGGDVAATSDGRATEVHLLFEQ
jgi:PAS domain S-box-containing protein